RSSLHDNAILSRVQPAQSRQACLNRLSQCQVHIIAAQQEMVADRLADEPELSLLLDGLDQAEVAGTAPDVHYQAAHTGLQIGERGARSAKGTGLLSSALSAQRFALRGPESRLIEQAIERGRGLLQDREVLR